MKISIDLISEIPEVYSVTIEKTIYGKTYYFSHKFKGITTLSQLNLCLCYISSVEEKIKESVTEPEGEAI